MCSIFFDWQRFHVPGRLSSKTTREMGSFFGFQKREGRPTRILGAASHSACATNVPRLEWLRRSAHSSPVKNWSAKAMWKSGHLWPRNSVNCFRTGFSPGPKRREAYRDSQRGSKEPPFHDIWLAQKRGEVRHPALCDAEETLRNQAGIGDCDFSQANRAGRIWQQGRADRESQSGDQRWFTAGISELTALCVKHKVVWSIKSPDRRVRHI